MKTITVGILGCGTVGQHLVHLLHRRAAVFQEMGTKLGVAGVLVRSPNKARDLPSGIRVTNQTDFLDECNVLIEAIGGIDRPLELVLPHLRHGRPLITANKALLAERWSVLKTYAMAGQLYYEAAVMAGTPVIGPMSGLLRASRFIRLQALLNSTCQFILSQMEEGLSFDEALRKAQSLGYAEDPATLDIDGIDAAHKLTVLARLCINGDFSYESVRTEGIRKISKTDIIQAKEEGKRIKLVAELSQKNGSWQATVSPQWLSKNHPLCASGSNRNAMIYEGQECGLLTFAGGSTGGMVTASAMVGDLVHICLGMTGYRPLHPSEN